MTTTEDALEVDVRRLLEEAASVARELAASKKLSSAMAAAADVMIACLRTGGKILLCGNGGSAADCQHMAGELVGRFRLERPGLAAVALTTDTSVLTAIGNDYGYADIFRRQVEALGDPGDVLMAYSTSGNAENCILAVQEAQARGLHAVALTGRSGGRLAERADIALRAPADATARVQECHLKIGHVLCDIVERAVCSPSPREAVCAADD